MTSQFRSHLRTLLASAMALAALSISACALLPASESVSVSDPNDQFHFKIPRNWQSDTSHGFISVYADKKLPAPGEAAQKLSLLVLTSTEPSSAPVSQMLEYLISARANQRGWTHVKKSPLQRVILGGRPASSLTVSATVGKHVFESRYFFVRTPRAEVFVAALAPPDEKLARYSKSINSITQNWFWHDTAAASPNAGGAPK